MKQAMVLSATVLLAALWLAGGLAARQEPEQGELVQVTVSRSGGMEYGTDFFICVTPEQIESVSVFSPDCELLEGEAIPIAPEEWAAVVAAVEALDLEEDIPESPGIFDRLREKILGTVEILDGPGETSLYLTWQNGDGCQEVKYLWPGSDSNNGLWEVLFDLAQAKAQSAAP